MKRKVGIGQDGGDLREVVCRCLNVAGVCYSHRGSYTVVTRSLLHVGHLSSVAYIVSCHVKGMVNIEKNVF